MRTDTGKRLRADELAAGEALDPGPAAGVGLGDYGTEAPSVGMAPDVTYAEKLPHGVAPLPNDRYVAWDTARGGAVIIGTDRLGVPRSATSRSTASTS